MRAGWLVGLSYRLQMVFSVAGLLFIIAPLYFIAQALQPVMAASIEHEGRNYFGFLIVGMITLFLVTAAVNVFAETLQSGIERGTLETLLMTPTRLPLLLVGMVGYNFSWMGLRSLLVLVAAWILGVQLVWGHGVLALAILALIILAYIPFGLMVAALVLAFRTKGPWPQLLLTVSVFLGGVYYPTHVMPSWLEGVSTAIPLTYGLRALRRTLLDGAGWHLVASDVAMLGGFVVVLLAASVAAFAFALRYARRAGTLAQY
jgi:ABC-2 type transport system permease protein